MMEDLVSAAVELVLAFNTLAYKDQFFGDLLSSHLDNSTEDTLDESLLALGRPSSSL